jgi:hypothetical protein
MLFGLLARHAAVGFTYFSALVCRGGSFDCKQPHTGRRPVAPVLHRLGCFTIPVEQHCGQRVNVTHHCQLVVIRTVHGGGQNGMAALQRGRDVGEHRFYRPAVSTPCARPHYTNSLLKKWTDSTEREVKVRGANIVR